MLFLQAHSKLSLASHGQQQQWGPLSVVSKPLLMGCFEAHDFPEHLVCGRSPTSQSQFLLHQSLPGLLASVSPLPTAWAVQLLLKPFKTSPRLGGSAQRPPACRLLTRPSRVSLPSHLGASLSCLWLSALTGFRSKLVVYVPGSLPGLLVPQNKD